MATTGSDHEQTTAPEAVDHRSGRFERTGEPMTTASPLERHDAPTADTATRSGKGTASFITGIVGVLAGLLIPIVGLILGIVATVLGHQARKEIRASRKANGWMATSGFVLGIVAICISVAIWAAAVAITAS